LHQLASSLIQGDDRCPRLSLAHGEARFFENRRPAENVDGRCNRCKINAATGKIEGEGNQMMSIDPLTASAVLFATAATDAVYVMFTSAVVARKRVPAASWSSVWYLLSSYAVISYTENWVYVAFAAAGSWIGAFASISFLHRPPGGPPVGAGPE
jgi:hypothetical protein